VNRPGLVQPVDGRPVVSTGVGITLVVAGAILRFAVTATFAHVLNAHVAGVIVMLAGVFALLLSLLVWGPLNRRRGHSGGGRVPPGCLGSDQKGTIIMSAQRIASNDSTAPFANGYPPPITSGRWARAGTTVAFLVGVRPAGSDRPQPVSQLAVSLDALSSVAYGKAGCPHPRPADRAEFENPGKV
jgi:hypothetical protein